MDVHQSTIVLEFDSNEELTSDEELLFLKQFFLQLYTPTNLNFSSS